MNGHSEKIKVRARTMEVVMVATGKGRDEIDYPFLL